MTAAVAAAPHSQSNWYCSKSVDRLQSGFESLDDWLGTGLNYTDSEFGPQENQMIYWDNYNTYQQTQWYKDNLQTGYMSFERFSSVWPDMEIFAADRRIQWTDINQGGAGTCYIKSAMASLAEFPELVRETFVNEDKNDEGIYNVKFYVRGKPWIVTIDENLLFMDSYGSQELVFALQSKDNNAIWGAVLEKAWAKVKGNYLISDLGGITSNGIRALTGVPVFDYWSFDIYANDASMNDHWQKLIDGEEKGYIMTAGTAGQGDDSAFNACGIAKSHAYSLIAAFTMTDAASFEHRMLMIRNPWGENNYSWKWSRDDPRWTDELIAQVPHNFNPKTANPSNTGVFVVPFEAFKDNNDVGYCFIDLQIGHYRDNEGYSDTWYDVIDANEDGYLFTFQPETATKPIYFTVETYGFHIIPSECTEGYDPDGWYVNAPLVKFKVDDKEAFYSDYYVTPFMFEPSEYSAEHTFNIKVQYTWLDSPRKDFTLKVYSVDDRQVLDSSGNMNMLHTDGQSPSEFEYIADTFPDGRSGQDEPEAVEDNSDGLNDRFDNDNEGRCENMNGAARDEFGDGCQWYRTNRDSCGQFDDSDFVASDLCCHCGGGCKNTADDAKDSQGHGCGYYKDVPALCGNFDDDDFVASEMCCACKIIIEQYAEDEPDDIEAESEEEEAEPFDPDACQDTNNGAEDYGGDTCEWYAAHPNWCGTYDDNDFKANEMCCACQYYEFEEENHTVDVYEDCQDTNGDYFDVDGDGCEYYNEYPEDCGYYDTWHFYAKQMCCACAEVEDWHDTWEEDHEDEFEDWYGDWDEFIEEDAQSHMDNCEDTNEGATDTYGDDCQYYWSYPDECEDYNHDDFDATEMCCACGGGNRSEESETYEESENEPVPEESEDDPVQPVPEEESSEEQEIVDESEDEEVEPEPESQEDVPVPEEESEEEEEIEEKPVPVEEEEEEWEGFTSGKDIQYEEMANFNQSEWVEFVEEDLFTHDPTVNWNDIVDALETFKKNKAYEAAIDSKECADIERGGTDSAGYGCAMYTDFPNTCGMLDSDSFESGLLCCACGGGTAGSARVCHDTNEQATDLDNFGCAYYNTNPGTCGEYDDDDFRSNDMCCACGGGENRGVEGDFDPMSTEVSSAQDIFAKAETPVDVAVALLNNPWVLVKWFDFENVFE